MKTNMYAIINIKRQYIRFHWCSISLLVKKPEEEFSCLTKCFVWHIQKKIWVLSMIYFFGGSLFSQNCMDFTRQREHNSASEGSFLLLLLYMKRTFYVCCHYLSHPDHVTINPTCTMYLKKMMGRQWFKYLLLFLQTRLVSLSTHR